MEGGEAWEGEVLGRNGEPRHARGRAWWTRVV